MTEDEARAWLSARNVSRETLQRLDTFAAFLADENQRQNLVSAATLAHVWARHIVDSAQLLDLAGSRGTWADLGSGPGFPGLIVAAVGERPVTLIEERAKRVQFLREAAELLGIAERVTIVPDKVEKLGESVFDVISARAFAPLPRLLALALPLSTRKTQWLLPKGRRAADELAEIDGSWQGTFEIVPSATDPESAIIVATNVTRGNGRR